MTIQGWGVGGTPIFSFIFRCNTFGSMKICGVFFFFGGGGGGHYEIGLFVRGVISIHFRAF